MKKFVDTDKMQAKEDRKLSLADDFKKTSIDIMNKHKQFLDGIFEMIINHPFPVTRYSYWKEIKPTYDTKVRYRGLCV